jgi:hypothetical protein
LKYCRYIFSGHSIEPFSSVFLFSLFPFPFEERDIATKHPNIVPFFSNNHGCHPRVRLFCAFPRTQGAAISNDDVSGQLSQPSRPATPADLLVLGNGPEQVGRSGNRFAQPARKRNLLQENCSAPEDNIRGDKNFGDHHRRRVPTPPPVFPEFGAQNAWQISGTFHGSGEIQAHNGEVKIPARAVCDGLAGKTGGGFGTFIPSTALLGQGPRVQRSRSPKLRLLSLPTHPTTPADVCVLGSATALVETVRHPPVHPPSQPACWG